MEDYRFDVVLGAGLGAQTMEMKLERFTLVGATTRTGLLASPLRDRFPIQERLDYYGAAELKEIAVRAARKLSLPVDPDGAEELARRARGTPRIAIRLLQRARDFAQIEGDGRLTRAIVDHTLQRLEVDARGLDAMDRRILATVIDTFGGGPVGIEAIAAAVGEEPDTIEDVYEPFLVREVLLARTPRGRVALPGAYGHLGRERPRGQAGGAAVGPGRKGARARAPVRLTLPYAARYTLTRTPRLTTPPAGRARRGGARPAGRGRSPPRTRRCARRRPPRCWRPGTPRGAGRRTRCR